MQCPQLCPYFTQKAKEQNPLSENQVEIKNNPDATGELLKAAMEPQDSKFQKQAARRKTPEDVGPPLAS